MLRAPSLLFLALVVTSSAITAGSDWPRFLGPEQNGRSSETGIRTDWSGDGLPLLWERKVGTGYSPPVVADGRLFLFDRAGDQARLRCLKADTGEEIWSSEYPTAYEDRFEYSNGPRASPVVDGERVFTFGVEGRLRAHRVTDGLLLWEIDTAERYGVVENFFGVGSTPIVEDDLLLVMIGGSPADQPHLDSNEVRGDGTGLVAFDKATGEERYRASDELASYSSLLTRTIDGRRWAFAFARGGLIGFEPGSGKVDFHFPWRAKKVFSVNAATPVVVGDRVLITESYGPGSALLRVRPGGYEIERTDPPGRNRTLAAHWSTPVFHEGHLYGSSGEKSGNAELRCLDFATGEIKWSEPGLLRSTILYADGHLLVLNEHGRLLLVRATPERFDPVTEIDLGVRLGHPSWNAPVLAHGRLYLHGADRLMAFELVPSSGAAGAAR